MGTNTYADAATNALLATTHAGIVDSVAIKADYYHSTANRYAQRAFEKAPDFVFAVIIILATLIAARIVRKIVRRLAIKAGPAAHDAIELMALSASVLLWALGVVLALDNAGVNVGPLIAGLGLTGFAVGFALKDALTNVLCGVLIIMYRPFKRGDRISVSGIEGVVSAMDLRYTTLVAEGKTFLVPNTTVFNNPITIIHQH